jgi:hypothetical protein
MMSTPRRLLVPLLVAVVALGLVALDRAAPNAKPCATADKAATAGLYQQAQKAYTAVLAEHPDSTCAQNGLLASVRRRCSAVQALVSQGATDDARKAYISMLAADLPALDTPTARAAAMFETQCVEEGMAITSLPIPRPATQ